MEGSLVYNIHFQPLPFLCGLSRTPPPSVMAGAPTKFPFTGKRKIVFGPPRHDKNGKKTHESISIWWKAKLGHKRSFF